MQRRLGKSKDFGLLRLMCFKPGVIGSDLHCKKVIQPSGRYHRGCAVPKGGFWTIWTARSHRPSWRGKSQLRRVCSRGRGAAKNFSASASPLPGWGQPSSPQGECLTEELSFQASAPRESMREYSPEFGSAGGKAACCH